MARPFINDESKAALAAVVREVEATTSAELVVAVRPRSGTYLHADLIAGAAGALTTLAVLLFSPWEFDLVWFLLDPVLAGILTALLASRLAPLRRALTRPEIRRQRAETAARALFVERRVHGTAGRTGILLYVSVLEREAVFVVDVGVEALAATDAWRRTTGEIETEVRRGADGAEVARRLRGLEELLSPALERRFDDVDELPNEVC